MKNLCSKYLCFGLLGLAACSTPFIPTVTPDYRIEVKPTAQGSVAIPPACPTFADEMANPYDNQPEPQFGCASARNLADMIERPDDLIEGRKLANARAVTAVGAIRRYDNNQPRGLITPAAEVSQVAVTSGPAAASQMTGDVTGGAATGAPAPAAATVAP